MIVVAIAVNARHIVLGAALRPKLNGVSPTTIYASAILLSDANWAATNARQITGVACCGHLVGGGLILWIAWTGGTVAGTLAGTVFDNLGSYGLDVIMPAFFATMLYSMATVPRRDAPPWAVAAVIAGGLCLLVPAHYAALAGTAAGGVFAWFAFDHDC